MGSPSCSELAGKRGGFEQNAIDRNTSSTLPRDEVFRQVGDGLSGSHHPYHQIVLRETSAKTATKLFICPIIHPLCDFRF